MPPQATAPARQPAAAVPDSAHSPHSFAFEWDGRVYAFGARWYAFHRADRRSVREAVLSSGATHLARIDGGEQTQVATYRLPQERSRMFAAAEAVRIEFGSDFIGVFELAAESLPEAWWLIAVFDDIVLADRVLDNLEDVRTAYAELVVPGRQFGSSRLPSGFEDSSASPSASLADFLELSDLPLRRADSRGRALTMVAAAAAATGFVAAAAHGILAAPDSPAQSSAVSLTPARPMVVDPLSFALDCEAAVASAYFAELPGWRLRTANCRARGAALQFEGEDGPERAALAATYPAAHFDASGAGAIADVPIRAPISAAEPKDAASALEILRSGLSLLDPNHFLGLESAASAEGPYDVYRFELTTGEPAPVWLQAIGHVSGSEISTIAFAAKELRWRVEGRLHVTP